MLAGQEKYPSFIIPLLISPIKTASTSSLLKRQKCLYGWREIY